MENNYETSFDRMFDYDRNSSLDFYEKTSRINYVNNLMEEERQGVISSHADPTSGNVPLNCGPGIRPEQRTVRQKTSPLAVLMGALLMLFILGLYVVGFILAVACPPVGVLLIGAATALKEYFF